jgi:hypothetical protein
VRKPAINLRISFIAIVDKFHWPFSSSSSSIGADGGNVTFTDGGGTGGNSERLLALKLTLSEMSSVQVVCGTIFGVLQTSDIGITNPFYIMIKL